MTTSKKPALWTGFQSVLCAIDFSDQSRRALRYAEAVARRGNAELAVAYVNDPLLIAAAAAALHDRLVARQTARELRSFVDAALPASSRNRLHVRLEAPTGQPADAILEIAARRRSDLIVMGTHGLTGANRLLLGSTTLTVLQRTPIPVLAIPPFRRRRTAIPPTWPGERIVAALDFEDDPDRAVEIAARVAQWFGSALLLVHVIAETRTPAWAKVNPSTDERVREAHAQQQIARLAAAARRRVATEAVVVRGRVSDRIAALAATTRIGLTITALRDRRSWFGSTRGAVSYQVLSDAATPVLAYPPGWTAQLHRRAV